MGTRHLYWILTGPLFAVYTPPPPLPISAYTIQNLVSLTEREERLKDLTGGSRMPVLAYKCVGDV